MNALLAPLGIGFLSPWLLLGLLALPFVWWLLRATPPAPLRQVLPSIEILRGLKPKEVTADRTPWWLLLLRLLAVASLIIGFAGPLLSPEEKSETGPLLLVVDKDWTAAKDWSRVYLRAQRILRRAEREGRLVYWTTNLNAREDTTIQGPLPARDALKGVQALTPAAWSDDEVSTQVETDRVSSFDRALADADLPNDIEVIWLSSGVVASDTKPLIAATLSQIVGNGFTVFRPEPEELPLRLLPPERVDRTLEIKVERLNPDTIQTVQVVASDVEGKVVTVQDLSFEPGQTLAQFRFDLPRDVRNRIFRLELEDQNHVGAVQLLDDRWQQRSIGIISSFLTDEQETNRLLSETFYLDTALKAFADVESATVDELLARPRAVLFWPDANQIGSRDRERLAEWVEGGGTLVRFAGPNLAQTLVETGGFGFDEAVDLLPVRLRVGDRSIGGALNWERPATLQAFDTDSLFSGIKVPEDLAVRRQLLAEPDLDLPSKSQALLTDNTPLVTATPRGDGRLVFFHVGATPRWSNLPLSLLFVDMLQRLVLQAESAGRTKAQTTLAPLSLLDAFGRQRALGRDDRSASPETIETQQVSAANPPGLYGTESEKRALNLVRAEDRFQSLEAVQPSLPHQAYAAAQERALKAWFLVLAFGLLLLDLIIRLAMNGGFSRSGNRSAGLVAALACTVLLSPAILGPGLGFGLHGRAYAQDKVDLSAASFDAILNTRLAYIKTGDGRKDANSRAGLLGLTRWVTARTSIELDEPHGLKLGEAELTFYPLIYWPISKDQASLPTAQVDQINAYLNAGGMLIIDTQDASTTKRDRGNRNLIKALRGIAIPPLQPIPEDHVLTKSFYLLDWFPGRWANGEVWVAANATGDEEAGILNDGVSPVILGGADWAGAWALTEEGTPLFPVVPGVNRQRIMAFRFGTNAIMYALAGNYKADQIHVNAILDRIGGDAR